MQARKFAKYYGSGKYGSGKVLLTAQIVRPDGIIPYRVVLPNTAELSGLSKEELLSVLQRFGVAGSWDELRQDAAKYVSRISSRQWTPEQLKAEVDSMLSTETERGLTRIARRVYREVEIREALNGDNESEVVFTRLGEGDERMCDGCAPLAGFEGTLVDHAAVGMPGSETCDGNEDCRCTLMRAD